MIIGRNPEGKHYGTPRGEWEGVPGPELQDAHGTRHVRGGKQMEFYLFLHLICIRGPGHFACVL